MPRRKSENPQAGGFQYPLFVLNIHFFILNIHFFILNIHFCISNVHFFFDQKSTYMEISIIKFIFLV